MLSVETYKKVKLQILEKLKLGLAKNLYYHGLHHTLDVLAEAERIAREENISGKEDNLLLNVACVYHDSGFLVTYKNHEEAGCKIVSEELPSFGFTRQQIQIICEIIMATKIPQTPHNKLEEIICDADLDYLGRNDFFPISNSLFREVKERGWVDNERDWNIKQVAFFKAHHYFTPTNKNLREKEKQKHLEMIEAMI